MTSKIDREASWVSSQARMWQSEEKLVKKNKFHKSAEWSIERFKDKFVSTKKIEDTEECKGWRSIAQTEKNSQWKDCVEIGTEVLEKYGVEEIKRNGTSKKWITIM